MCSFRWVSEERETSAAAEPQPSSTPCEVMHTLVSPQPETKLMGNILVVLVCSLLVSPPPNVTSHPAMLNTRNISYALLWFYFLLNQLALAHATSPWVQSWVVWGLRGLQRVDGADSARAPTLTSLVGWISKLRAGDSRPLQAQPRGSLRTGTEEARLSS